MAPLTPSWVPYWSRGRGWARWWPLVSGSPCSWCPTYLSGGSVLSAYGSTVATCYVSLQRPVNFTRFLREVVFRRVVGLPGRFAAYDAPRAVFPSSVPRVARDARHHGRFGPEGQLCSGMCKAWFAVFSPRDVFLSLSAGPPLGLRP